MYYIGPFSSLPYSLLFPCSGFIACSIPRCESYVYIRSPQSCVINDAALLASWPEGREICIVWKLATGL
jgi:hypothetical protein